MVGLKSEALNLHSFGLPAYGCKNSLGCTEVLQNMAFCGGMDQASTASDTPA